MAANACPPRARERDERAEAMISYATDSRKCQPRCKLRATSATAGPNLEMWDVRCLRSARFPPPLIPPPVPWKGVGTSGSPFSTSGGERGRGIGENESVDPAQAPIAALAVLWDDPGRRAIGPFALGKTGLMRTLRGTPGCARPGENRTKDVWRARVSFKKGEVERLIDALMSKATICAATTKTNTGVCT